MTIKEIKDFLTANPQYYSNKNDTDICNISSKKKYYFISDCGHESYAFPNNIIKNNHVGCSVCSGKSVLVGTNDLNSQCPEVAQYLKNKDDGFKYTKGSNAKVEWTCPNCGYTFKKQINQMTNSLNLCPRCSNSNSYPERLFMAILDQLKQNYKVHVRFSWSNNREYDFYFPHNNCIVELHGKQHYTSSDFSYLGGKTYIEESENDNYKKNLALHNGISLYIIIDCRKSEMEYIRDNILQSELPQILCFKKNEIDWLECHNQAIKSKTVMICKYYEDKSKSIDDICKYFKCCHNTVVDHLKKGAKIGLCSYIPEEALKIAHIENGQRIIHSRSKEIIQRDKTSKEIICRYNSIQNAQRKLKISHIWDCVVGKRKTAGGYIWEYA